MEPRIGEAYFLVQHIDNGDYFIRQILKPEDLQMTGESENQALISVPRAFLEGVPPEYVGRRLVRAYRDRKREKSLQESPSIVDIERTFAGLGTSLSMLLGCDVKTIREIEETDITNQ